MGTEVPQTARIGTKTPEIVPKHVLQAFTHKKVRPSGSIGWAKASEASNARESGERGIAPVPANVTLLHVCAGQLRAGAVGRLNGKHVAFDADGQEIGHFTSRAAALPRNSSS
jgi:hypothetical protein